VGNHSIAMFFPNGQITGNILVAGPSWVYPAGNYFPASIDDVGFIDFAAGLYGLLPESLYCSAATDGTNPGVDFSALLQAFAAVQ
jgi:hypothetical protein